ncbi:MAG: hypothetical protein QME74_05785 [Candidatus Edwardsbacteria bacterium]|nr:hypothetical protein [Candidatus Edwardsbacteria bacterium]
MKRNLPFIVLLVLLLAYLLTGYLYFEEIKRSSLQALDRFDAALTSGDIGDANAALLSIKWLHPRLDDKVRQILGHRLPAMLGQESLALKDSAAARRCWIKLSDWPQPLRGHALAQLSWNAKTQSIRRLYRHEIEPVLEDGQIIAEAMRMKKPNWIYGGRWAGFFGLPVVAGVVNSVILPLMLVILIIIQYILARRFPNRDVWYAGTRISPRNIRVVLAVYILPVFLLMAVYMIGNLRWIEKYFLRICHLGSAADILFLAVCALLTIIVLPLIIRQLLWKDWQRMKPEGNKLAEVEMAMFGVNVIETIKWFLWRLWAIWVIIIPVAIFLAKRWE